MFTPQGNNQRSSFYIVTKSQMQISSSFNNRPPGTKILAVMVLHINITITKTGPLTSLPSMSWEMTEAILCGKCIRGTINKMVLPINGNLLRCLDSLLDEVDILLFTIEQYGMPTEISRCNPCSSCTSKRIQYNIARISNQFD